MLNFTITELVKSDTAEKNGISNTPDINSLDNLLELIFYVLQPLRDKLGKPITITSGFRSAKVNQLVGGVGNSQHLYGQAADMVVSGMTPAQLVEFIKKSGVEFDQCIEEHSCNTSCVHISYNKNHNRKQILLIKK